MDYFKMINGKHGGKYFFEIKQQDPTYFIFLASQVFIDLKNDYIQYIQYCYNNIDNYIFSIGKYKGIKFNDVRKNYPSYFIFLSKLDSSKIKNEYKIFIKYCIYYLTKD